MILVLDTETTGLPHSRYSDPRETADYDDARLIEIAYGVVENDRIVKEVSFLVDSVTAVPNTHIHGITVDHLRSNGLEVGTVFDVLLSDLEDVDQIVAHNVHFDCNILLAEAFRVGRLDVVRSLQSKTKRCTMLMGKEAYNLFKYPKLSELYQLTTGRVYVQKHRATDDMRACVECYVGM